MTWLFSDGRGGGEGGRGGGGWEYNNGEEDDDKEEEFRNSAVKVRAKRSKNEVRFQIHSQSQIITSVRSSRHKQGDTSTRRVAGIYKVIVGIAVLFSHAPRE